MEDGVPTALQEAVAELSTSLTESVPEAVVTPTTPKPASATAPRFSEGWLEMTGASFVPLIVTVTVWSTIAPNSSVARTT